MERTEGSKIFPIGSRLPEFQLKNVDKNMMSSADLLEGASALLVIFTCNHCPYVKGSERQLIATIAPFKEKGVKAVAINSNDPVSYPEDSFEKMQEKSESLSLPYPYLFDETQQVARSFDAACTPECFLFNSEGVLVYHGAINDSHRDSSKVTVNHLENALMQVLSGGAVEPGYVHTMGCSIKWVQ